MSKLPVSLKKREFMLLISATYLLLIGSGSKSLHLYFVPLASLK